ncbi:MULTISPECIES: IclR family transcriptional regulator [unclassified Streptomyces]|uniref:IclR family transcriptional regulator n=1 Tax=unclassified Streptomyces TaxID=2593676 RepID=UPI00225631F7|nr:MULTISPECIES: IclR family transcriptional regulator [unclassified Streptomyces]MCX5063065.1 IclR family transcriptional regulator [Streptomyces sp. NBC_00452]
MITPHSAAPERSVVDRTLTILGAFDRDNPTLTLSDISRRAALPLATVHRIVSKLHTWGALERCADGLYSIGLRLWETAVLAPRSSALVEAAQPHLIALHGQTSGAAVIAIRDGGESVCLSFVYDDPGFPHCSPQGSRVPLHATAVGLVLLAHADQIVQNEVCDGPLTAYTPLTLTDGPALKRLLGRIRREGHAAVHGTLAEGRGGFAVPVRDGRGAVVAAVGVVAPSGMVHQPARLAHHVHAAANAISQSLRAVRSAAAEVGT